MSHSVLDYCFTLRHPANSPAGILVFCLFSFSFLLVFFMKTPEQRLDPLPSQHTLSLLFRASISGTFPATKTSTGSCKACKVAPLQSSSCRSLACPCSQFASARSDPPPNTPSLHPPRCFSRLISLNGKHSRMPILSQSPHCHYAAHSLRFHSPPGSDGFPGAGSDPRSATRLSDQSVGRRRWREGTGR